MRTLLEKASRAAPTSLPILITGESGTGKELLARAVHESSCRAEGPFLAVNCSGLIHGLAESLLFGHRKGAFTSAESDQRGYFQAAEGGTLLLDEVGDFPQAGQGSLLRTLQDGSILPVGATSTLS